MSLERTVIDNIRRIRKEKGISQEKLAELCETATSYIGLMEIYRNIPKLSTIERIAEALHVEPLELFIPYYDENNEIYNEYKEKKEKKIIKLKEEIMSDMSEYLDTLLVKYL